MGVGGAAGLEKRAFDAVGDAVETGRVPLVALLRVSGDPPGRPGRSGMARKGAWSERPDSDSEIHRAHHTQVHQPTLIFLALHVAHPVRLFLWARRPTLAYPGGCCIDGVGVGAAALSRDAGVGGVAAVVRPVDGVEAACSAGDSRSDMTEGSRDWPGVYNLPKATPGTGRLVGCGKGARRADEARVRFWDLGCWDVQATVVVPLAAVVGEGNIVQRQRLGGRERVSVSEAL